MRDAPPKPKYTDDLSCREIYAETVQVVIDTGGLLRIELCANRWNHEPPVVATRVVPVARIALPVGLGTILRDQLTKMLEGVQKAAELAQAPAASQTKQ